MALLCKNVNVVLYEKRDIFIITFSYNTNNLLNTREWIQVQFSFLFRGAGKSMVVKSNDLSSLHISICTI